VRDLPFDVGAVLAVGVLVEAVGHAVDAEDALGRAGQTGDFSRVTTSSSCVAPVTPKRVNSTAGAAAAR
jgi:hypothetical protein